MTPEERKQALKLIWRHTHRDYKGKFADGTKTIMVNRGGTCLMQLDALTDADIADKLPYCQKLEEKRLAKKATV